MIILPSGEDQWKSNAGNYNKNVAPRQPSFLQIFPKLFSVLSITFQGMMKSGILNRSLFRIQINFGETLQEIQSVGEKKKIDSDDYRGIYQDVISSFVGLLQAESFMRTTLTIIPNQTLLR